MKRPGARCVAALLAAPAVAIAQPPMSYLHTFGPAGDPTTRLGQALGIVSIAVIAIIAVLVLAAIYRQRMPPASPRELTVARDEGGLSWIYLGVGISTVVLIACAVWTMFTVAAVAMPASAANLTLHVTASQWWWDVRYHYRDPAKTFDVANEIHVPVGTPVKFELESIDVIHSFWIPQLGGKTDVIPGQTNVMWLQADRPGVYRGQCGEYCGAQHAHMAMVVIADPPAEFAAWSERQRTDAATPSGEDAARGAQAFVGSCGACHRVRGTEAGGILGPDLTHLMSRRTIAAGLLPNTPGYLSAWIADAQSLKPGARMPTLALSGRDLHEVVSYLETLK
jgi:cytochrome c oxidase subunit 2